MAIPDFIPRKPFVQGSFRTDAEGSSFALSNTFAPVTRPGVGLEVNVQPVPPDRLTLQLAQGESRPAAQITAEAPFPLPVNGY